MTTEHDQEDRRWKKAASKKPYVVESRFVGSVHSSLYGLFKSMREWHVYSRYATERARNDALATLRKKDKGRWEYRIKGEQTT